MRAALYQMTAGPDPAKNAADLALAVSEAAVGGADILLTPEVSNCLGAPRALQRELLHPEETDPTLAAVQSAARDAGIWVLLGSLALQSGSVDGRFANRSILLDATGTIRARYDKIHMFDVALSDTETYTESAAYRPGDRAVVAKTPFATFGLSICYDLRFPHLYRRLAKAGANVLTVPSAFARVTGAAHWHTLLRARAIETGCFVVAPAQVGTHGESGSGPRQTYGHSLVVSPWGEVIVDAGSACGITFVDLDLADVGHSRTRVPSLGHDRVFDGPEQA